MAGDGERGGRVKLEAKSSQLSVLSFFDAWSKNPIFLVLSEVEGRWMALQSRRTSFKLSMVARRSTRASFDFAQDEEGLSPGPMQRKTERW
jgi:hypothetical protein